MGEIVTGLGRATRFGAPPGAVSAVAHNLCPPGMEQLADEVVDHTQHRFVPSLNPCAGPIRGRIFLAQVHCQIRAGAGGASCSIQQLSVSTAARLGIEPRFSQVSGRYPRLRTRRQEPV